jgi:hypothetical protein
MAGLQVHLSKNLSQTLEKMNLEARIRLAEQVAERARQLCSSHTVAESVEVTVTSNRRVLVGSPLDRARWLEEGTGIYGPKHSPIVPVRSKVLVFPSSSARGGYVFVKSASGDRAKPFLGPALHEVIR